ncbi:restriction endonuclease subunit S [Dactylococcopsis salina]|uniref:Restriction endonuclease S subunit n=1 Tax=Dactylococcopsis salina (strain PCC 8305) TaxID=13035 RepID=K9YUZ7_DACS8|nr:restriction endonuclease subunit S [Dactylococcopsis salina]AFZ50736.1 restriction endonuclease S subunit [Dactylococcopsis salina PCC 8305]
MESQEVKEGYKLTEVGVIPEDWEVPLLDQVAKRGSGHTPDQKYPEYWNGNIKWISLKDSDRLDAVYIYDTVAKITQAGIDNSSAKIHPLGTVVLSRDAGVGKSAIMADDMAVSQHFMAWICISKYLNNHFLYYWLQKQKSEFERIAIGSTIKTIGLSYFKSLKIPLPPLPEQEKIAQVLSDVDSAIAHLDKLINKKRNLKQGTMQQLLTEKKRLSSFSGEWEVKPLGDFIDRIVGGGTPSREQVKYWNGKIFWATVKDITSFCPYQTEETITKEGLDSSSSNLIPKGTLIISTRMAVGKAVIYDVDVAINQDLKAIYVKSEIDPEFLLYCFCYYSLTIQAWGSGSTVKGINLEDLKKVKFPYISFTEQKAIAQILTDMDAEIEALEKKRDKYKAIKQGMMQELLTGKTRLIPKN